MRGGKITISVEWTKKKENFCARIAVPVVNCSDENNDLLQPNRLNSTLYVWL